MADTDSSKSSFAATNDSWLDTSDSGNFKTKTKNNGTGDDDDDEDDDMVCGKETSYVPVKGQKMAAKRLKKIQGLYIYLNYFRKMLLGLIYLYEWEFYHCRRSH